MRRRLLDTLDRFGIAHAVLAIGDGARRRPTVRRAAARAQPVDRVVAHIEAAGAPVRYRRVRSAITELHALAAQSGDERLAEFLSTDETVLAVMAAAVDVVEAAGRARGPRRRCGRASAPGGALAAVRPRSGRCAAPKLRRRHLPGLAAPARAERRDDAIRVAAADAVVAAIEPGLSSPGVESRDVVLVAGPWLAGTTSLIAALRERMPEHTFVEADELAPADAPAAVVFVVSAIAPLTESDCALIDFAANYTDLVVGVVSKIDAHRNWRDVLAADRALLAAARAALSACAVGGCGGRTGSG